MDNIPEAQATEPLAGCRGGEGPPCTTLLTDPSGALTDRNRQPWHVCIDTMKESTRRWALDQTWACPERAAEFRAARRRWVLDLAARPPVGYLGGFIPIPDILTEPGEHHGSVRFTVPDELKVHRPGLDSLEVVRREMGAAWDWWQGSWPLPIGRRGVQTEVASFEGYSVEASLPILAAVPFDGEEKALLVLRLQLDDGASLELFVQDAPEDSKLLPGAVIHEMGRLTYRLRCRGAISTASRDLLRSARDWFAQFAGASSDDDVIRRTKPKGSGRLMSREEFRRRFWRWLNSLPHKGQPTKTKAAADLGISVDTLNTYLSDANINWDVAKLERARNLKLAE